MTASGENLGERAQGWLRFLHHKATTPDDWSEGGEPHPWWDRYSTPPMTAFPRFDLSESSYAMGMMADVTPAWREVYTEILDELVARNTTFWAAVDWLTQIGNDPDRENYPDVYRGLIPSELWGRYDVPGWTANGVEPWGLQKDPIRSTGNLFFRGFFNLILSTYRYVAGDRKWERPFHMAGVGGSSFEWRHSEVAKYLSTQWGETPRGPHCENTKIWPYCLSAAGLGLKLFDAVEGTGHHWVFERWVRYCQDHYMTLTPDGRLQNLYTYYDPIEAIGLAGGPAGGLAPAFYIAPQDPTFASLLYESGVEALGWRNPDVPIPTVGDPRILCVVLNLAREFGDDVVHQRLREIADTAWDPRRFGEHDEYFGYWFGLEEDWPRGQLSSLAVCADVGEPGAWSRVFREPNLAKFDLPSVTGIDFPRLSLDRALHRTETKVLEIETVVGHSPAQGDATRFRVENLPDATNVRVRKDGEPFDRFRRIDAQTIEIDTTIDTHRFDVFWGNGAESTRAQGSDHRSTAPGPGSVVAASASQSGALASAATTVAAGASLCPCCA